MQTTQATRPEEIIEILRRHGTGSLSYSALQEGMLWYTKPDVGFIQYEKLDTLAHNAVCLGDPVCSPKQQEWLLTEFLKAFPDPILIHVSKETGKILEKKGFYINEMGVETIVDAQTFSTAGSKKEFLRSQKNRAQKDGVVVREMKDVNVSMEQLQHISDEWLHKKAVHDHELAFLVRPAVFQDEPDVRKFVAMRGDEIVGFVFFDPMYRKGKVYGYLANILRTLGAHSYSVTDFIILEAITTFKSEGIEDLSLGFSPFTDVDDQGEFNYSKPLQDLFKYTYEHANYMYSFKSLAFHKGRYRPDAPGARQVKVYCATKHSLPLWMLYGVFRKMGIAPVAQTAEHAVQCVEEMVKGVPDEVRKIIRHLRHADQPSTEV